MAQLHPQTFRSISIERNETHDESLDPRIQVELESLNRASDKINSLELQLEEINGVFRNVLYHLTQTLNSLGKKLGKSIENARPYYEARFRARQAQAETQRVALNYERACSMHEAAKEMVQLAELEQQKQGKEFDPAWLEMLNHATMKVKDAVKERNESEMEHRHSAIAYNEIDRIVQKLHKDLKKSIAKSRPYFDTKAKFNQILEEKKKSIEMVEEQIRRTKLIYGTALHNLEVISDQIHVQRIERQKTDELGVREAGVGADCPSPPPSRTEIENEAYKPKPNNGRIRVCRSQSDVSTRQLKTNEGINNDLPSGTLSAEVYTAISPLLLRRYPKFDDLIKQQSSTCKASVLPNSDLGKSDLQEKSVDSERLCSHAGSFSDSIPCAPADDSSSMMSVDEYLRQKKHDFSSSGRSVSVEYAREKDVCFYTRSRSESSSHHTLMAPETIISERVVALPRYSKMRPHDSKVAYKGDNIVTHQILSVNNFKKSPSESAHSEKPGMSRSEIVKDIADEIHNSMNQDQLKNYSASCTAGHVTRSMNLVSKHPSSIESHVSQSFIGEGIENYFVKPEYSRSASLPQVTPRKSKLKGIILTVDTQSEGVASQSSALPVPSYFHKPTHIPALIPSRHVQSQSQTQAKHKPNTPSHGRGELQPCTSEYQECAKNIVTNSKQPPLQMTGVFASPVVPERKRTQRGQRPEDRDGDISDSDSGSSSGAVMDDNTLDFLTLKFDESMTCDLPRWQRASLPPTLNYLNEYLSQARPSH